MADVLAAVLTTDPDWSALPADTPPRVRDLLRRCLAKDRTQRLRDIGDARLELLEAAGQPAGVHGLVPQTGRTARRWWVLAASPLVLLTSALGLFVSRGWAPFETRPAAQVVRFAFSLATGQQLSYSGSVALAPFDISPDGSQIVFAALQDGRTGLYLRRIDQFDATPLAGTNGASGPFFSPDGKSIGFFANGKLKRIQTAGGPAEDVCGGVGVPTGGTWGDDDRIVFASDFTGLFSVPAKGGTPNPLTRPDVPKGEVGHIWPHALPGGRGVVFSILTEDARWIAVLSSDTGRWQSLRKAGGEARYLPTGHLLYQEASNLLLAPFDLAGLKLLGEAMTVFQGLPTAQYAGEDRASIAVSLAGTLVHEPGSPGSEAAQLVWVSRSGESSPLPLDPAGYFYPRVSPDGARVAVNADNAQILVCEVETGRTHRLTRGGINYAPVWSPPDGGWIAFAAYRSGAVNIFWKPADGDDEPQPLVVTREGRKYPASWSRDGTVLIYNTLDPAGSGDVWSIPLGGTASPLRSTPFLERLARLSPDGRWLAYVSNESGRDEVYVRPFAGPGETKPVSTEGGTEPVWSNDSRELFYVGGKSMMAVEIGPGTEFRPGKIQRLFDLSDGQYETGGWVAANYDVRRDGRFLMVKRVAEQRPPAGLKVVVNWFEELKAKVPISK